MDVNLSNIIKVLFNLSNLPPQEQNILIAKYTFLLLVFQIFTFIIALAFQVYIKRQDISIESAKFKSNKIIKLYQKLYTNIDTIYNDIDDRDNYLNENISKIKILRALLSKNGLYFSKSAYIILKDILDNLTIKVATPNHFDINKHSILIDKFKKEFNKI